MSPDARRTVSYSFTADRSAPPPERLATWLNEPPIDTTSPELPYHMDAAHAHLLEQLPRGLRVLEIGCGGGQCRPWFQGRGFEYVGVDVSKTRVFNWLQRYGGPDLLCDTHFLPFKDQSFDAVYCAAVTEHLASPQLAAQEIFRVLKPRGHYLGNCSFLEPWHDNSFYHMTPLGAGELLTTAGFEVLNIWPSRGYSGYRSLTAMGFRPPLRVLKHVGQLAYGMYRLQNRMQAAVRKMRHRAAVPDIFNRAKVAGATDWIAKRPV
jgi:ubiquinone/menaquinone biosynthesis C-methylase UbiE